LSAKLPVLLTSAPPLIAQAQIFDLFLAENRRCRTSGIALARLTRIPMGLDRNHPSDKFPLLLRENDEFFGERIRNGQMV